jgi:hypothetical protein
MYTLDKDVTLTYTEQDAVLLNQRTGRYWLVNDTGAIVLRHLLDGDTIDDAMTTLRHRYADCDPALLEQECRDLLENLVQKGLMTP